MQAPPIPPAVPPAAQPAPPQLPQPNPATVPNRYLDHYLDACNDSFGGNYVNLYNDYLVRNTQPAPWRHAVYKTGNSGNFLHGLVHVRDPRALPDDPGTIVAVHRLVRQETLIGLVPKPFGNLVGLACFI
jgi:hypothetical protein